MVTLNCSIAVEPVQKGLENPERHLSKSPGFLVPMNPLVQIGLGKGLHPICLIDIQKVTGFHSIAHREGYGFQHIPAYCIFS